MKKSQGLVVIICMFLFTGIADATQFKVGGSNGWCLPKPNTISYYQWASMNRFKIGDSLLFTYAQGQDSVLLVNQDAYNACNTSSYIKKYEDGNTIFTFDRSGPFFFISGIRANCQKNELLHVVVLGDRTNRIANQPSISPSSPPSSTPVLSPSTSRESSPSLSPTASAGSVPVISPNSSVSPPPPGTGAVAPSPGTNETGSSTPPSGEENPISPPEGNANPNPPPSGEENPISPPEGNANPNPNPSTPSPSSPPPPNGAPLKVVGLIGSIGPLLALAIFAL